MKISKDVKENITLYIIILIVTAILSNNFLQMHYSSDTYVLMDLGYMNYPQKYFLLDGRIISSIVCLLAGILNIPYKAYIIGMDMIAILFLSMAIKKMYELLIILIKPSTQKIKVLILLSTFVLLFNQFTLEYLLFPESAIMCLSVLLSVIAIRIIYKETKYKYLKIFLLLLIIVLSYQGAINIFPILAIFTYFIKHLQQDEKESIKIKLFIIEMLKLAILVIIVLLISNVVIKICWQVLDNRTYRRIRMLDLRSVEVRIRTVMSLIDTLWNKSMNMLPTNLNNIVIIMSIILLISMKAKKENIINYIFVVLCQLVICIVPMFIYNTEACCRVNNPIAMVWGVSLIWLIAILNQNESPKKLIENITIGIVIISFIINSVMLLRNSSEHIAANKVDENMGATIKSALERYEKESNIKVTKFGYIYDLEPQQYAVGIKKIGSLTERKIACSWCIKQAINYYCERKFEFVSVPMELITKNKSFFEDYDCFSEEQLVFYNDAMFLCVY